MLLPAAAVVDPELRALAAAGRRGRDREAGEICEISAKTLDSYEQPPLADVIRAELEEHVTRRRAELGG